MLKRNTAQKRRRGNLVALCVILSLVLVGLLLFCAVNSFFSDIRRVGDIVDTYNPDEVGLLDPTDTQPIVDQADAIEVGSDVINILLVGQDRREGQGRMHSDAMILCTINKKTKTLTMTSFMRDMWVYIPDHYNERINVPYMVGGFPLLNDTLEYNFGIRADYNVEIDFSGFMDAIDLIGGVDIELTQAEADYLNRRGNWEVEENQGWQLKAGVNHLTGSQALAYSRVRAIGDDFERTNRQRTVINAVLDKTKTLSAAQLYDLVKGVMPLITTDMTNAQIMSLSLELIPMLSDLNVVSQRIPMDNQWSYANKSGADVIVLSEENFAANKKLLEDAMRSE